MLNAVRVELDAARSLADLQGEVDARWRPDTSYIEIVVRDEDRRPGRAIANEVAKRARRPRSERRRRLADRPGAGDDADRVRRSTAGRVLGGGLGAGLLVALLIALGRDRRTETVENATDVENAAVAPLLAHLTAPADLTSMPALRPGSAEADMFRHLRLALEAETSGGPSKKVVVAGVSAGEVDVWLGANAAISLANVGRRVLLVDGRMGERSGGRPARDRTPSGCPTCSTAPTSTARSALARWSC